MAKTAMVTGASGGIGLEFAERLAKDGTQVTLVARSEGKLKDIVGRLGAGLRFIAADLSVPADTARVADDVRASKYDLLVNNAGVGVYGAFAELPLAPTQAMMRRPRRRAPAPSAPSAASRGRPRTGTRSARPAAGRRPRRG